MITATEYYLSKALQEILRSSQKYFKQHKINSRNKDTIRLSNVNKDVVEGHFKRLESVISLFKDSILKDNNYKALLKLKKEVAKLTNQKEYDNDGVVKKVSLIEDATKEVERELEFILKEAKIIKESSRYVTFVCPNERIKDFVTTNKKEKYLVIDGKELLIGHIADTEDAKIIAINKKEYLNTFSKSSEEIDNRKSLNLLKLYYKEKGLYFAPTKLGLAPIFEYDAIRGDKEFRQYFYDYKMQNKIPRLRYFDMLELIRNNFVPNCIVTKQVKAFKGGLKYNNGWYHSRLVNTKNIKLKIQDDMKYDDPEVVKAELAKWRQVYKENRENKNR